MLEQWFGDGARVAVVGMYTGEFERGALRSRQTGFEHDLVYHAGNVPAKGLRYALALAERLPTRRLLLPYGRTEVERASGRSTAGLPNLECQPLTWETGLREAVSAARAVLCPSLWSAPIEGALIKSLIYNGCVAAYDGELSFARELPPDAVVRLTADLPATASALEALLDDGAARAALVERAQQWVGGYIDQRAEQQARLFDLIERGRPAT
jgi:hypothetical protein